jgi:DNA-binding MarR family transcriptional regulator
MAGVADRVTLPQFRILVLLSELGAARVRDVAHRVGVHPSTLSRTADRLVEAGFVRRAENPASRRETLLALTPPGRRLMHSVMQRRSRAIRVILGPLTSQQRAAVASALSLFAAAADEPGRDEPAGRIGG